MKEPSAYDLVVINHFTLRVETTYVIMTNLVLASPSPRERFSLHGC